MNKTSDSSAPTPAPASAPKTAVRASKFTVIGILLTLINFVIYTIFARTAFANRADLLWLDSIISYLIATFVAYFLHSRITWRERRLDRITIIKFFIWNIAMAVIISPFFTWLFGLITPVYQFAFSISSALHLPFDYSFVQSTGIFGFTAVITMILNYLCYDKFVFDKRR